MDQKRIKEEQLQRFKARPELLKDHELPLAFLTYASRSEEDVRRIFASEENLIEWMEIVRKESFRRLRACLTVLRDYHYLLDEEKLSLILAFLAELLSHKSGMVRRIAARTYGFFLAKRLKEYGTAPDSEIRKVLFPGSSLPQRERRKVNYQLKYILEGFREHADEGSVRQLLNHVAGYFKSSRWDRTTCFYLIMGIIDIPCDEWTNLQKYHILSFLRHTAVDDNEEVRLAGLYLTLVWLSQGFQPQEETRRFLSGLGPGQDAKYCEHYLLAAIHDHMKGETAEERKAAKEMDVWQLFQENQHSHALWINKILNLSILKEHFYGLRKEDQKEDPFYNLYATHLTNMLRLNKQAVVFLQAGKDLIEIMPFLASYQKFEIVKDILQSLENVDDYYNFIAPYAGRAFLSLEPSDQLELVPRLWELVDRPDPMVVNTSLEVVAEIIRNYYPYMEEQTQAGEETRSVLIKIERNLCSILSTGMASYKPRIAREAFFLTGKEIFGHVAMKDAYVVKAMVRLARKALISLTARHSASNDFTNYAAIKNMGKVLSDHAAVIRQAETKRKIAFFTGTFDPFSRAHKVIARELTDMGYRVYVDAHDFSWYKKLQPKEVRRQIIYLSISDLEEVLLFPEEYPISIENPENLAFLRSLFPDSEITMVVGSDVIERCEAYWKEPEPDSIHSFPHIVFQRGAGIDQDLLDPLLQKDTLFLRVPSYFDSMTSAEIQKQISLGRDFSDMVDHQAVNYVQDRKLYRGEPVYKKIARTRAVDFDRTDQAQGQAQAFIAASALSGPERACPGDRWLFLKEARDGLPRILAAVSWHESGSGTFFDDCEDFDLAQSLRAHISGKVLVITGLYADKPEEDIMIAANELLADYQKEGYSYALVFQPGETVGGILKRFGFLEVPGERRCLYVDLRHPITMFYDADSFIKEPFYQEEPVRRAIRKARIRLGGILTGLYPGNLILHFDSPVINHRVIGLITKANAVSEAPLLPVEEGSLSGEDLGKKMCVPFGKLLKGVLIPNTITRELNIEKLYTKDLNSFVIREFPEYESLRTQIRTVRAFRKPVIFVDDLYHKGYRMQQIRKLLSEEDVTIDRFIVGLLSGMGKDLAEKNGLEIESVYYVTDMRAWILESDLYPFVGGDGIMSDDSQPEGISGLPSTNLILPYQIPRFLEGTGLTEIYHLSETALINAREIFLALEKVYQGMYSRSLTFERMGEVMAEPRYPEGLISQDQNDQQLSDLLAGELAKLRRLRSIMLFDRQEPGKGDRMQ